MAKTLVSLFSGCGGLDIGFRDVGFEIVWANDFSKDAVTTYQKNIGNHIVLGDITKIDSNDIPNDFDVLTGGFPCQGFSIANSKRNMGDQRNFLYLQLLRILKDKQPKVFVAENVKGILSMDGGRVFQMILDDFKSIGYKVDYKVLNASSFGVPQNRERVIIIGNRIGVDNLFPNETHIRISKDHKNTDSTNKELIESISVEKAISFLSNVRTRDESFELNGQLIHNHVARLNVSDQFWARKFKIDQHTICDYLRVWRAKKNISTKKIDEILGYKHTAPHWFRKDGYGSLPTASDWIALKKILDFDDTYDDQLLTFEERKITFDQSLRISNWNEPSDTLTASGPEIHPNKTRRLSVRECAILQSFPMDFVFIGSLSSMYSQIGNAVPCLLANRIAQSIQKMLDSSII
jgi:DNA (cytosine-5)-methyltransferase 1